MKFYSDEITDMQETTRTLGNIAELIGERTRDKAEAYRAMSATEQRTPEGVALKATFIACERLRHELFNVQNGLDSLAKDAPAGKRLIDFEMSGRDGRVTLDVGTKALIAAE